MPKLPRSALAAFALLLGAALLWRQASQAILQIKNDGQWVRVARRVPTKSAFARRVVESAKAQIGTRYDASFQSIAYPMGDVAPERGACTDVIVRALRSAGVDLQQSIHEDMALRFAAYPQKWGEKAPNPSIDHRRMPNQMKYLQAYSQSLTTRADASTWAQWQPGDIVYWNSGGGRLHTGIISDGVDDKGEPFVIHNGSVCIEDHALTRWPIIGHFRWKAAAAPAYGHLKYLRS
jgi:uncharacterized protein YijF (DUF1287 family)